MPSLRAPCQNENEFGHLAARGSTSAAGNFYKNCLQFAENTFRHIKGPIHQNKSETNADRLANKFWLIGESAAPAPYLWEAEESLLFKHSDKNVQGDPRSYLKKLENDVMSNLWKEKAPKQCQWFTKHPIQVVKQAKQTWKWKVGKASHGSILSLPCASGYLQIIG